MKSDLRADWLAETCCGWLSVNVALMLLAAQLVKTSLNDNSPTQELTYLNV